jgi:hypothetical protein
LIEAVPRLGYRFVAKAVPADATAGPSATAALPDCSHVEERSGLAKIGAVILRREARDESREPIRRGLRLHATEARRGTKLEEERLLLRGG